MAYAIVSTVSPNANDTPRKPIPTVGNPAARTALPHPPRTSHNVPMNSAVSRLDSGICATCVPPGHVLLSFPTPPSVAQLVKGLLVAQVERVDALQRRLGRIIHSLFPHGGKGAHAALWHRAPGGFLEGQCLRMAPGGFLEGRCLRMADYVRGRRPPGRRIMLMLPTLSSGRCRRERIVHREMHSRGHALGSHTE